LKTKEDEYNILLMQKENEIQNLKAKLYNKNNINKFVEDEKNNINENIIDNNINNENIKFENNYRPYMTDNINRENNLESLRFKKNIKNK